MPEVISPLGLEILLFYYNDKKGYLDWQLGINRSTTKMLFVRGLLECLGNPASMHSYNITPLGQSHIKNVLAVSFPAEV